MSEIVTYDFGKFGQREIELVRDLLTALIEQGYPEDASYGKGIKPAMNSNSGFVWLESEEYDCAMLNGDRLELFFSSPDSGHEGFLEELVYHCDDSWSAEDIEWLIERIENSPVKIEESEVNRIKELLNEQN